MALYHRCFHEAVGVQLRVGDLQFVDDDAFLQQRPQLDVGHHVFDVGNGVALVNHHEVVDGQIQWE